MMLLNIYNKMYHDIQDSRTWKTLLTNHNHEPILLTHEYLPHPEDFLYTERDPPIRPLVGNHIMYAEKPKKKTFAGNFLKKKLCHIYTSWKEV